MQQFQSKNKQSEILPKLDLENPLYIRRHYKEPDRGIIAVVEPRKEAIGPLTDQECEIENTEYVRDLFIKDVMRLEAMCQQTPSQYRNLVFAQKACTFYTRKILDLCGEGDTSSDEEEVPELEPDDGVFCEEVS